MPLAMPQMGIAPGEWDWMKRIPNMGGMGGMGSVPVPASSGSGGGFNDAVGMGMNRLGNVLFPAAPGTDPSMQKAAQSQAMLALGLGLMAGRDRPGAGLGSSLFNAYQVAQQSYQGAQDQAFRNTLTKRQEERSDAQAKRQEKQDKREQQATDAANRQTYATTAGRIATGLGSTQDPAAYWKMVSGIPEVQETLKSYGVDPAAVTPEMLPQIQQQLATAGAVGGPVVKPEPLQLKAIVNPKTGKPILVPEALAVGQVPYEKSSKGISMRMPDGTEVQIGGDGSVVSPGELSKPTVNALQETIVNSSNRLDRLNATLATYNPDFLRAKGVASALTTRVKDFMGLDVTPEQGRYLYDYATFQTNAAQDLTLTLKELSGVAVNPAEYARAEKTAPSGKELSPIEFEAKARATTKFVTRAIMRANWALKNGIGVDSVEKLSKAMPLEGIDQVYEQRANEIWQELGGTPEARKIAVQRANQEFGLAR